MSHVGPRQARQGQMIATIATIATMGGGALSLDLANVADSRRPLAARGGYTGSSVTCHEGRLRAQMGTFSRYFSTTCWISRPLGLDLSTTRDSPLRYAKSCE